MGRAVDPDMPPYPAGASRWLSVGGDNDALESRGCGLVDHARGQLPVNEREQLQEAGSTAEPVGDVLHRIDDKPAGSHRNAGTSSRRRSQVAVPVPGRLCRSRLFGAMNGGEIASYRTAPRTGCAWPAPANMREICAHRWKALGVGPLHVIGARANGVGQRRRRQRPRGPCLEL